MLFMVIENFRDGDPVPVYRRFRDSGRLMPAGVRYLDSWVTSDLRRCFQVVDCVGRAELDQWIERWKDLVDFEVMPVMTSGDARAAVGPKL
jgi:hypothetical protein